MTKLVFQHTFENLIWKLIADKTNSFLAIELRDIENRKVTFDVLNIDNQQFINNNIDIQENWWVGMEALTNQFLILHFYDQQLYAHRKGIYCINLISKSLQWKLPRHTFVKNIDNIVYAELNEKDFQFDLLSGNEIIESNKIESNEQYTSLELLKIFDDDVYFVKIKQFVFQILKIEIHQLVEYLEYKNYILISFYTREVSGKLKNDFIIFDQENKKVIIHENLGIELSGVGTNTFCVLKNKLVLCKNKKDILIYEI